MRMETQEDSMSEAISQIAALGSAPTGGVYPAAPAAPAASPTAATAPSTPAAAQPVDTAPADPASLLAMSKASGLSNQTPAPTDMTMEEAAQAYQTYLKNLPSDLQFQPDYQAGLLVFKVVNPVTQQVIRQLPPEAVVQQARNLRLAGKQANSGILLDESL